MNTSQIKRQLTKIINNNPDTIEAFVANEALQYHHPKIFFEDLQQYGCISGMVSSLIYYRDTHEFFNTFYEQIQTLKEDVEGVICEPLHIKNDIKNFLAWFAFEETAYRLYSKLCDLD